MAAPRLIAILVTIVIIIGVIYYSSTSIMIGNTTTTISSIECYPKGNITSTYCRDVGAAGGTVLYEMGATGYMTGPVGTGFGVISNYSGAAHGNGEHLNCTTWEIGANGCGRSQNEPSTTQWTSNYTDGFFSGKTINFRVVYTVSNDSCPFISQSLPIATATCPADGNYTH